MWEYRVVPVTGSWEGPESRSVQAAKHVAELIRIHAVDGWEYFRSDLVPYNYAPGCLTVLFFGLFSDPPRLMHYAVLIFRRPVSS